MSDEYEGWANRETWALQLWATNEEGVYNLILERVTRMLRIRPDQYPDLVGRTVIRTVMHYFDIVQPDQKWNMRYDVGSIWRIDEAAIGDAWIETVKESLDT